MARSPILDPNHKAAKAAADFLQALNAGNAVVRRADNPLVMLHHIVHNLVGRHRRRFIAEGIAEILGNQPAAADPNILHRLFLAFSQMAADDQAPVLPAHRFAVFRRRFLGERPQFLEAGGAHRVPGDAHGQDRRAVLAGQADPGRGLHRGHGHRQMRLLIGAQLQHRLVQLEPVAFVGEGFRFVEQAQDDAQGFVHHFPLPGRIDAQHQGVGGQGPGADAQDDPAAGQMIQQHHPIGDHQGMMIGQADDAGAEAEIAGALGGGGDKDFRGGDGFPPGAVVFADIGCVKAQGIQPLQQFQVPLQGQGRVFPGPVKGGHKDPELHPGGRAVHCAVAQGRHR